MWWRLRRSDFARNRGQDNRRALRRLVGRSRPPGLIGYYDGEPAAWISLGPRQDFEGLEHSRRLRRVDDAPVWSIVCFFVARPYRGRGLMARMVEAAAGYARARGARQLEAYPVEPGGRRLGGSEGYMGVASVFRGLRFRPVARREGRTILRRRLAPLRR
jgi:GNAT superfamily N-acetyltransferase